MTAEEKAREAFVSDLLEQAEWAYADGKVRLQSLLLRAAETIDKDAAAIRAAREEEREAFLRRACRTGRGWHVLLLEDEINAAAAIRARGG